MRIKTDVLIIGSGLAGLAAAIKAAENKSRVIVTCKAPAGYNSCTLYSGGAFRAAFGEYSLERHFVETIIGGWYINDQDLVRSMVMNACKAIISLMKYGVELSFKNGRAYVEGEYPAIGQALIRPLLNYAQMLGVRFLDRVAVLDLVVADDRVHGAIFYNIRRNSIFTVWSKAVVLATGGYGGVYVRTDCPIGTTGDGCAVALRSGVKLADMEFIQFFPLGIAEPKKPSWLFPAILGRLINKDGEDIVVKYGFKSLADAIINSRDLLSRAMYKEIISGRGIDHALLLDISKCALSCEDRDLALKKITHFFMKSMGISGNIIKVAPTAHFTMGGILIKHSGSTDLEGLFACGEVSSGVHGANRLGGNGLTEALVFGLKAGENAAYYAKAREKRDSVDDSALTSTWRLLLKDFKSGNVPIEHIRRRVRELMWLKCGIIRSSQRLNELLAELREIKSSINEMYAERPDQVIRAIETINMITVSEAIAESALRRKESRGAHYREDYPKVDNARWLKRIVIKQENNKLKISYQNVNFRYLAPE